MTRAEFAAVIREKYLVNGAGTEGERFETYDALFHTGSKLIEYFSSHENILISVSGCPFNLEIAEDLQAMYFYEPNLYNACMSVFKQSYELTDRFQCRKKKCIPDGIQLRLF